MTLQEAKDQIAKNYSVSNGQSSSYKDWQEMEWYLMENDCVAVLLSRFNETAELYARSKWDEACEEQRDRCVAQFINSSAREYCSIAPKPEFKP